MCIRDRVKDEEETETDEYTEADENGEEPMDLPENEN